MKYHRVEPNNLRSSYEEYSQLDFDLVNSGKIKLNTIRFCFDIITPSGAPGGALENPTTLQSYYYDNLTGGHSFIDSITTEFSGGKKAGIIENIQSYPRMVKMTHSATSCNLNQMNSAAVCEGRASSLNQINNYVRGEQNGFGDAPYAADTNHRKPSFAVKPKFCLNSATSESAQPELSTRQSGSVRVSIRLARNEHVYFGGDSTGLTYSLGNCRLTYISISDDGKDEPIFMNTKINIKKSVNADSTNMAVRIPAVVQGVSCSFLDQSVQNDLEDTNTLDLQRPEGISRVVFSFNDAMNRLISYELDDESNILHHYLRSFSKDIDANQASIGNLKTNDSYGIGANFGQFLNLMNQRFAINIQSKIGQSNKVYVMYAYFHSLIQV